MHNFVRPRPRPGSPSVCSSISRIDVSLDGQSVELPDEIADDVSSLANMSAAPQSLVVSMSAVLGVPSRDEEGVAGDGLSGGIVGMPAPPSTAIGDGDGDFELDSSDSDDTEGFAAAGGCLPAWVTTASPAVKAIMVLSVALLVGSVVLVAVAAGLSAGGGGRGNRETTGSQTDINSGGVPPVLTPTSGPESLPTLSPTSSPTPFPTDSSPSSGEVSSQPTNSTKRPSEMHTPMPSVLPSSRPSDMPSAPPSDAALSPTSEPTIDTPTTKRPSEMHSPTPSVLPSSRPSDMPSAPPSDAALSPTTTSEPTIDTPTTKRPSEMHSPMPSVLPSTRPSDMPSAPPSDAALSPTTTSEPTIDTPTPTTEDDTLAPAVERTKTTFYVTGDRFQGASGDMLVNQLQSLPTDDGEWIVHLGDFNNPASTSCSNNSYADFSEQFSYSPLPVFVLPGDNDFNDCPNPDDAWLHWMTHLSLYDERHWDAPTTYHVRRQSGRVENFAYALRRIQFIGLNLVNGYIHNASEWTERHASNLEWVRENVEMNFANIELVVIFGHATPDFKTRDFFEPLMESIVEWNKLTLYIHETNNEWNLEENASGISKFMILSVQGGSWPLMRVEIDTGKNSIDFNQNNWHLVG